MAVMFANCGDADADADAPSVLGPTSQPASQPSRPVCTVAASVAIKRRRAIQKLADAAAASAEQQQQQGQQVNKSPRQEFGLLN